MNKIKKFIKTLNSTLPEWLSVEPETLSLIIQKKGTEMSEIDMDMINAIRAIITTDTPWSDIFIFENVVDALNGNPVIPETITKPPLEDIMVAVSIMQDMKQDNSFSDDIAKYIAAIAQDEQILLLPPPIDFANKFIPPDSEGIQKSLKESFEKIINLPFDYPYQENPIDIQVQKITALLKASSTEE